MRTGVNGTELHARTPPPLEQFVIGILRLSGDRKQVEDLGKLFLMGVVIGVFRFHLFVCILMLAHQLFCGVEQVVCGEPCALLFHVILHDEQKRLMLHGIVFEKL